MNRTTPTFLNTAGLARAAGCHRNVVLRLLASDALAADAFVDMGGVDQPLFVPARAIDVARHLKAPIAPPRQPEAA